MMRVAIIGAGMAGLSCARRLADAGIAPVIFDKGRGIGGRLATRRTDGMQFDHGAQYVTARGDGFSAALRGMQVSGSADVWADGSEKSRVVGVPGMSALARALSAGLDVRQSARITAVRATGIGWSVLLADTAQDFDWVVITVPAPQIAGLLGDDHPFAAQVAVVSFAPCLTLMAAMNAPPPFVFHSDDTGPLAWIAQDSSKPGRVLGSATTWVAQASPAFSAQYLEEDTDRITARMLPLLCERLGVAADQVTYASSHRWRYARVTSALGLPFLKTGTLYAGGDWCIGPRVEAAWTSGDAIATDILGSMA